MQERVFTGHIFSNKGIELDKVKVEMVGKLPQPTSVKSVRSFLGHVGFYLWFIKDFLKNHKNLLPNCLSRMCLLIL